MAKGGPPTHSVLIPVNFVGRDGTEITKWFEVGSAWDNGNGKMNFNLVNSPGVNFQIVPNKAWDERKKATVDGEKF
jgi:hypothetical protein